MQTGRETTRRSFPKLGLARLSTITLLFVAGCAGAEEEDDDDDGGRRRRRRRR